MTSKTLTVREAIDLKKQNGGRLLTIPDDFATSSNKSKDGSTFYVPVRILGNPKQKPRFKFTKQVIGGKAKCYGSDNKNKGPENKQQPVMGDATIPFIKLDETTLEKTDYKKEQYKELLMNNAELIELLDTIADDYKHIYDTRLCKEDGPWGPHEVITKKDFVTIRQCDRKALQKEREEDKNRPNEKKLCDRFGKIKLDKSLFRIKLPIDRETRLVGRFNYFKKVFEQIVYDVRKKSANKGAAFEIARLKNAKGDFVELNDKNVGQFITTCSIAGGIFEVENICFSKSGMSLIVKFHELYIMHHRPFARQALNEDEVNEMSDMASSIGGDVDVIEDEGESKRPVSKPKPQFQENETPLDDPDEPTSTDKTDEDSNNVEDDDQNEAEEPPAKPQAKPVVVAPPPAKRIVRKGK